MSNTQADLLEKLKEAIGQLDLTDPDAISSAFGVDLVERTINHSGGRREFEAHGDSLVGGVELLLFPGAHNGHEATLRLNLDSGKTDRSQVVQRFGDLMVADRCDFFQLTGFPNPVLRLEGYRFGNHRLFTETWVGADSERLDAVGLMQLIEAKPRSMQSNDPAVEPADDFLEDLFGFAPPKPKNKS